MKKIIVDDAEMTYTLEVDDNYKGFNYKVTHVIYKEASKGFKTNSIRFGWRCGYVRVQNILDKIESNMPEVFNNIDSVELDFFGTLNRIDPKDDNKYIGFACNHLFDTVEKCDTKFCINECKKIIDQLIEIVGSDINGETR